MNINVKNIYNPFAPMAYLSFAIWCACMVPLSVAVHGMPERWREKP